MAVADALVSKVLEMLVSTVEQEVRLVGGVKKQVKLLTNSLQSIQAVLIDAEKRQLKEATVRLWLERLKDVSYDIDDVLDEWSFAIMKSRIEGSSSDYAPNPKRKVWSFILSSCFCFHEVGFRHDIAVKIKDLNERLDVIAIQKDKYGFLSLRGDNEQVERPITTSVINVSEVKGREVEKEKLVNLLLAESSELPNIHLISIVGMGGIGKTTLAKLVYNDEMVETHFDKRIWVCVSEPFDKIRIAKAILESLVDNAPNLVELQSIVVKIQQSVKGKKYLLVLDDVWNEDPKEWKQLEDCLIGGASGSKILVTTRKENVAKLMGCIDVDIFRVGLLSKEECWSLFCQVAFSRRSSDERENLETIGGDIAAKCKGLPLAVKTIAGLLRFKISRREWESVLDSELWKLEEVERDISAPLWLSYYDLPSSLKQCFLYCVIFPKDHRMSKHKLISLWMAHGFLKPTKDKDMEVIGHDYFHNLVMRSLFQDFEVKESFRGDKTCCKMHDLVHDFAESVMKKECLSIDVKSVEEATSMDAAAYSDDLHHLHVKLGEKVEFPDSLYNLQKLRSLVVSPPDNDPLIGAALPKIFEELTCLRSLSLSQCRLENIPSNISKLIHLRWLKLSKNHKLKELPETICELYNLQTLNVRQCEHLTHFPKGVEKLTNLRNLMNDYTTFFVPKGIGKLTGLRRLLQIRIDLTSEEAFSLGDLKNLKNISGSLEINVLKRQRDTLVEDAKQAQLKEKKDITSLLLNLCASEAEEWMQKEDEELVEALKPNLSLQVLRIYRYVGANSPSWINTITCLKKLALYDWRNCEHLPSLGKLACLEYIEFDKIQRVTKVAAEFFEIAESSSSSSTVPLFPKLKTLTFMNMLEWEEWNNYDGDEEVMPCLSSLTVWNCPKLKALPNFIREKTTLSLKIAHCKAMHTTAG